MLAAALVILLISPMQQETDAPLRLTLKRAVSIAVENNAGVRIATEGALQADSRVQQARAAFLPNVDAQVSQSSQTRNLEAMGVRINAPDSTITIPSFVGPFKVFDARATGSQTILDVSMIRRYQASKAGRGAAQREVDAATEEAAASVARAYVGALRADAELAAVRENITLAEAILKQAEELRTAGTGTGMEVTRAQVQLAHERQRLIVVQNERQRARLQLLRTMGLTLDTEIALDDTLDYRSVQRQTSNEALSRALAERRDYRAQLQRESNSKLAASATTLERLPSVNFFGDYGSVGTSINKAFATRTFGLSANIPIFDGGRRDARRAEAASQYRVEQVRTTDLQKQIALETNVALDSLRSAEEEVSVARDGLQLAEAELDQARRRYSNGVASSLEVTQAQTELARSRDNLVFALFHHFQARIDLGQATGTLRKEVDETLPAKE